MPDRRLECSPLVVHAVFGEVSSVAASPAASRAGALAVYDLGRNVSVVPSAIYAPTSLEDLLAVVDECGRAGRRVKPAASLHSWSACAVTDSVSIQLGALDRMLAVDSTAMTVRVEAGIRLRALYARLDEAGLALPSLPNVDTIQLGGAIANATHGTCIEAGSFCSLVVALELVVFQSGQAHTC